MPANIEKNVYNQQTLLTNSLLDFNKRKVANDGQ